MIRVYETYQGKNRCFQKGTLVKQPIGIVVHDTGANNKTCKRYVESPLLLGKNTAGNHWNNPAISKCAHAFIGLDKDGYICVCNTLPYEYCCWLVGGGKNGSYNYNAKSSAPKQFAHLQFEICEDSKKDKVYYELAMETAAEYCAYWCLKYNIPLDKIISHRDAARAGFGSNHSDIWDWCQYYGETTSTYMDSFRKRVQKYITNGVNVEVRYGSYMLTVKTGSKGTNVKYLQECLNKTGNSCKIDSVFGADTSNALKNFQKSVGLKDDGVCNDVVWAKIMEVLNGAIVPSEIIPMPPVIPEQEENKEMVHYYGIVKTNDDGYISIWVDAKKTKRLTKALDGSKIEVLGEEVLGTMAPAAYNGYVGFADTQYLVDKVEIKNEVITEEDSGNAASKAIVIPTETLDSTAVAALLAAVKEAYVVGYDDENEA